MKSSRPVHPGRIVRREMVARKWSDENMLDFGIDRVTTGKLLLGEINVDVELADKLSHAFGTSNALWLNLQKRYDGE